MPTAVNIGHDRNNALLFALAERADVIIDFSAANFPLVHVRTLTEYFQTPQIK